MLFKSEDEMQKWLESQLKEIDGLSELFDHDDLSLNTESRDIIENKYYQSFEYCLRSLHITEAISANENIALEKPAILKPDMMLYAPETQSIVIVELKNDKGATRQAGTELSAYAAEVQNYLPFISDSDIVSVIISTEWPTLLKRHIMQEIFWHQRKLICLEPYKDGDAIRLKIKPYAELSVSTLDLALSGDHVGGYQLCLYDYGLYGENPDRSCLDQYQKEMKAAMAALAAKGNALGSHGFAFLWKDDWTMSLAPYSMTICNIAPFNRLDRFIFELEGTDKKLSDMQERFIRIVTEHDPTGHGEALLETTKEAELFLNHFCTPRLEGFVTWPALKNVMQGRAEYISFVAWGVFGTLFFDKLRMKYQSSEQVDVDSPEVGLELIEEMVRSDIPSIDLSYYFYDPEEDEIDDLDSPDF